MYIDRPDPHLGASPSSCSMIKGHLLNFNQTVTDKVGQLKSPWMVLYWLIHKQIYNYFCIQIIQRKNGLGYLFTWFCPLCTSTCFHIKFLFVINHENISTVGLSQSMKSLLHTCTSVWTCMKQNLIIPISVWHFNTCTYCG